MPWDFRHVPVRDAFLAISKTIEDRDRENKKKEGVPDEFNEPKEHGFEYDRMSAENQDFCDQIVDQTITLFDALSGR